MPLFSQLSDADSRAHPGYASPGEQTHATTKAPSQCRILVVEDEGIIALDLSNTLRSLGHVVMGVAISGEQAIQLAVELKPDLVTMDIRLQGDIDGIEAAQQIRSRLGVPIIYVTAFADENTRQRAKMTNPAGFLSKPFVKSQLYEAIETAISRPASD